MQNLRKAGFVVALVATMLLTTACMAPKPDKSPEETVRAGLSNFVSSVDSGSFDLKVKADVNLTQSAGMEKMVADLTLTGGMDKSDAKNLKIELLADGSATVGADTGAVKAEVKIVDSTFYGILNSIPENIPRLPVDEIKPFVGKWIKQAMTAEETADLEKSLASQSEDQKKMIAALAKNDVMNELAYVGVEKIGGENSFHYTGKINKVGLRDLMIEAQGLEATEENKQGMDAALALLDGSGEIWVGAKDGIMRKIILKIAYDLPTEDIVNVDLTLEMGGVNGGFAVTAPTGAVTIEELMGA